MSDTDQLASEAPPNVPPPVDIGGWPTWLRRTTIAVVLLASFGLLVWACRSTDEPDPAITSDSAVILVAPADGAQALRQTQVGADLKPGWDGRLTIDGTPIPEEEMVGALDPETMDPKLLAERGIRPNNKNSVYFKPGPGKVIEEFDTGPVTIELRYFKEGQPDTARTLTWQIRVD